MKATGGSSSREVRTISADLQGRVAMSRAASGLVLKGVVRGPLASVEPLVHRVGVKAFAHLRAAHRMDRCTAVVAQRAGCGVEWVIALADGSCRSSSAVRVEI